MLINLSKGYQAIIDDQDAELVLSCKWFVTLSSGGPYAVRKIYLDGIRDQKHLRNERTHRFLMQCPAGSVVDHINGNTLDNRRSNLRVCSVSQNGFNRSSQNNNRTGFKGVSYCKDRGLFRSSIQVNGHQKHLGTFSDPISAAKAYDAAALELHGDFARPNFCGAEAV